MPEIITWKSIAIIVEYTKCIGIRIRTFFSLSLSYFFLFISLFIYISTYLYLSVPFLYFISYMYSISLFMSYQLSIYLPLTLSFYIYIFISLFIYVYFYLSIFLLRTSLSCGTLFKVSNSFTRHDVLCNQVSLHGHHVVILLSNTNNEEFTF